MIPVQPPSFNGRSGPRGHSPHERDDGGGERRDADVIVVGSGFGGAMVARPLVRAGLDVLMLERGDWVQRGEHNRDLTRGWGDRPAYSTRTPYRARGAAPRKVGSFHCVGGRSVYFGGVMLRFRARDFDRAPSPGTAGCDAPRWPFGYRVLRPHYRAAERILGVSGSPSRDPTAPSRTHPLPDGGIPLSPTSRALARTARRRGLHPFRLPMALDDGDEADGSGCVACGTCDGFACFVGAKNDLATAVLPELLTRGLTLRTGMVVTRLRTENGRVTGVEAVDRDDGGRVIFRAEHVVVAAGALATPHLLLGSGLADPNPAGWAVGRHLMRHCNAIVAGPLRPPLGDPDDFRKQIGIHDFYFGGGDGGGPPGKLGSIQQIRATRVGLAELPLPAPLTRWLQPLVDRSLALLVLAEDEPRPENRVHLHPRATDAFARPRAHLHHRYTRRDRRARHALARQARDLLRGTGVPFTVTKRLTTFSHALGTVRMGHDAEAYPVAPSGRYRGVENLWISDASVFPTAAAVNPSLTIAANALRVGTGLARALGAHPTEGESPLHSRGHRGSASHAAPPGRGGAAGRHPGPGVRRNEGSLASAPEIAATPGSREDAP